MMHRISSCAAALVLLAAASTAVFAQWYPDSDPRSPNYQQYLGQQRDEFNKRERDEAARNKQNAEDMYGSKPTMPQQQGQANATGSADMKALRQKLLSLPPLPVERNVLLGSWRQEGGGQQGAILGSGAMTGEAMIRELGAALLSNPDKLLPSQCVSNFGNGVTFAPSTFSIRALDGSTLGGRIAYRSSGKQGIWVIPDSILKIMAFEIAGPNRIVLGGSCALVRVGAPEANAAANAATASGNSRAAPPPARDGGATAMAPRAATAPAPPNAAGTHVASGAARTPIAPSSLLGRAVALHRAKDFQPALALLQQAAKAEPDDPRIHAYLASTYDWLGMSAESRQAADTARRIDPNALDILR